MHHASIGLLLLLASCSITGLSALPPVEDGPPVQVYFCPKDDCNQQVLSLLSQASDIRCALYSLDVPVIRQVLQDKKARLVVEKDNEKDFAGLDVVVDKSSALMHNKFCVLDGRMVISGSYNPTDKRVKANNVVVVPSRFVAENFKEEFMELRAGSFGRGARVRHPVIVFNNASIQTAFCPEDACASVVLGVLKTAKERIRFMTYSFTDDLIGSFLASAPVRVEGIFDSSQLGQYSEYQRLAGRSVVKKGIHHKVFIVDNSTVITGSYNPTKNGNERNDENVLVISDSVIAARFNEEFERLSGAKTGTS